jgi:hypothetical protein
VMARKNSSSHHRSRLKSQLVAPRIALIQSPSRPLRIAAHAVVGLHVTDYWLRRRRFISRRMAATRRKLCG